MATRYERSGPSVTISILWFRLRILNPQGKPLGPGYHDDKIIVECRSPTVNDLQGFVMAHLNIASLPKHIDELRLQLTKKPLDILSINETRLDDTINDGLIHLNGYDILRKDRNRMGGGVAIYFRDNINTMNRNELVPDSLEALCVEVRKPKSKPIVIL